MASVRNRLSASFTRFHHRQKSSIDERAKWQSSCFDSCQSAALQQPVESALEPKHHRITCRCSAQSEIVTFPKVFDEPDLFDPRCHAFSASEKQNVLQWVGFLAD
jgi:hypothetical protein